MRHISLIIPVISDREVLRFHSKLDRVYYSFIAECYLVFLDLLKYCQDNQSTMNTIDREDIRNENSPLAPDVLSVYR